MSWNPAEIHVTWYRNAELVVDSTCTRGRYPPVGILGCRPRPRWDDGRRRPSFSNHCRRPAVDPCSSAAASSFLLVHSLRPLAAYTSV